VGLMKNVRVRPYTRRFPTERDVRRAKSEEAKRQRAFVVATVGPEELEALQKKLYPGRFPGMSGKMMAIVGYIIESHWTSPQIDEMAVTSDGFVLASQLGDIGMNVMIGSLSDLERNWEALLDVADLTLEERTNAERLFHAKIEDHRVG
jgi:hypothetical protein